MVRAAVADVDRLEAGDHEIRAGGHSFTADTLARLAAEHPVAVLHTILGDDAAAYIHSWERVEEVMGRSRMVVVARPGNRAVQQKKPKFVCMSHHRRVGKLGGGSSQCLT